MLRPVAYALKGFLHMIEDKIRVVKLFGAIAGHAAERRIHISEAAVEITRAHAGEQ